MPWAVRAAITVCSLLAVGLTSEIALGEGSGHPDTDASDQLRMVNSGSQEARANKRLVFNFWREILDAGHIKLVGQYLSDDYIQHNPNVPTGRAGFVRAFSGMPRKPVAAAIQEPIVSIIGERDRVILIFKGDQSGTKGSRAASFDMFRIAGGRIVEHWDDEAKQ